METLIEANGSEPWNKGKLVGQKAPLRLRDIWAIRVRLQLASRTRDLALFNLGIDRKLRACDLVRLKVRDVCHGDRVANRAIVMQKRAERPVQFEMTARPRARPLRSGSATPAWALPVTCFQVRLAGRSTSAHVSMLASWMDGLPQSVSTTPVTERSWPSKLTLGQKRDRVRCCHNDRPDAWHSPTACKGIQGAN